MENQNPIELGPALELLPSPGTPGEGQGEGYFCLADPLSFPKTLTPTLFRRTGRGGILLIVLSIFAAAAATCFAESPTSRPDLGKPTVYVVVYAHLDTQWRWTYPQTIREYVLNTMIDNFPLLAKYPDYVFNFTGARRYEFMKEYYP